MYAGPDVLGYLKKPIEGVLIVLSRWICCRTWGLALPALSVAPAGCYKEKLSEPDAEPTADVAKPAESEAEIQAQVEAKLAKADLLDGTADKNVTRCARDGIEDSLDPGCRRLTEGYGAQLRNYEASDDRDAGAHR